jgi:hypothetical protein
MIDNPANQRSRGRASAIEILLDRRPVSIGNRL